MRARIAVVALVAIAFALTAGSAGAASPNGNQLLGSGTVTEFVGGGPADWTITFDIHARGNGQSSAVSITQGAGGPTSTFSGSVCDGTYTDPHLGGTDLFAIGPVISGNEIYGTPYEAYVVHEGGPLGADRSWSVPASLPDLASAQAYCSTITSITPAFSVDAASSLVFKNWG
ncbi:MAG: hypothetical protein ACYDA3_14815 [Gaiellaceae bacterium]